MNKIRLSKSFYYLWGTQSAANAADVLYIMALTVLVLDHTGSLISATLVPLFRSLSQMLSGLLAPLLIERFKLSRLLLLSQSGQFVFFAVMAAYLGMQGSHASLPIVFLLIFAMSFLDGWTVPARNALVPRLTPSREGLLRANGLLSVSDQVVQFAGWGLSGLIIIWIGTSSTLLLTAVIYALAALFTLQIREPESGNAGKETSDGGSGDNAPKGSGWLVLSEGWKIIWRTPALRALTAIDAIDMLGGSVWVGAFTLIFVQQALGQGEEWWGFINAAYFAGTIGGGLLVISAVRRIGSRLLRFMLIGMAGYGLLTFLYAVNTNLILALVLVLLMGPFAELSIVTRRTLVQHSVNSEQLPKVLSAQATVLHLFFCISLLGMAWAAETFGIVRLYIFAACLTCSAVAVGIVYAKSLRKVEDTELPGH
ncbi:MFS transporter [Paenibacillus sp. FSL R7-0273]|uniref:MFS transporter n=1 Tax=Paenibacillus sp. FSL R7-0273 TaxID=1536772 RepID=UPI0004F78D71|nr:MFS transporter [Paenibacillus sp. FSL R7-0273]AIQ47730.1 MFS transporter [Paenibacillus sp. FSL R7-0273]OMF94716.1 MFS transporter [Paenibacillus sp. FSL R7-0273]